MPLNSCIYECEIGHVRTKPRRHSFRYRHFMLYLDLDEIADLNSHMRMLNGTKWAPYRFEQNDHLPDGQGTVSLKQRVIENALREGITEEIDSVRLLTNVRFAGYVFNPVSFFFCFDKAARVVCCLVEVGNTFKEKKAYWLKPSEPGVFRERRPKLFYVSPFTELDQDLVFNLSAPDETINLRVDTMAGNHPVVAAVMRGSRVPLTDRNLLGLTLKYPFAPARVIGLIHLHALFLWLKKVPHHNKEERVEHQTGVMNPHRSLTQLFSEAE